MKAPTIYKIPLLLLGLLPFTTTWPVTPETTQGPILFILDASGSMSENLDGIPRMAAAQKILDDRLSQLSPGVAVGLVAYGNRIAGCRSHKLYTPIGIGNRSMVGLLVKRMQPSGRTPLAATLQLVARNIIPKHPNTTVIVISDGAESCGGNPEAAARELLSRGENARIHVIGLNVDWETASQLNRVSRNGKGKFYDVNTRRDFVRAISQSMSANDRMTPSPAAVVTPAVMASATNTHMDETFVITAVRPAERKAYSMVFEIDFRFQQSSSGDYNVSIQARPNPVPGGPGESLPAGEELASITGKSFYDVANGRGTVQLELTAMQMRQNKIYIQGELWETTRTPVHLYRSNSLPVRL